MVTFASDKCQETKASCYYQLSYLNHCIVSLDIFIISLKTKLISEVKIFTETD